MIKKLDKMHPSSVGFLQAVFVGIYCFLISGLLQALEGAVAPPRLWAAAIILLLFVVSAAISGLIVLGYPAYLALKQKIKRALAVISFTLIFAILMVFILLFIFTV